MGSFFNVDNVVFSTINKIVDMVLLSIIFIVVCLPIITIGPAITALYYVIVKVIRRERSYVFREFFKSFKRNFKQSFIINLIFILMYFILYIDLQYANAIAGMPGVVLKGIFFAILFLTAAINIYIYPVLSRFEVSIKQLFKNSFFMSIRHLPFTILMFIIVGLFLFVSWLLPIVAIITPALGTLIFSLIMEKVLKKYMPEKSDDAASEGIDEWYLE